MPIRPPAVGAWLQGMPISQHDRRHHEPERALQRDRRAGDVGQETEDRIGEMHQRHQHDQHGADVEQELEAGGGALHDRVHGARRDAFGLDRASRRRCAAACVSGTMIRLIRIAAGAPSTEAITRWAAASGISGPSMVGVDHQHGAGDAGHAAGHHDEQLAAGEARQIGPDEQRRLDHAEEDVGGGRRARPRRRRRACVRAPRRSRARSAAGCASRTAAWSARSSPARPASACSARTKSAPGTFSS